MNHQGKQHNSFAILPPDGSDTAAAQSAILARIALVICTGRSAMS